MFQHIGKNCYFGHMTGQPEKQEKGSEFFRKHYHPENCEMLFLMRGDVNFHVQNSVRHLQPGDLVFVSPGSYHFVEIHPGMEYERYVLNFRLKDLPEPFDSSRIDTLHPFYSFRKNMEKLIEEGERFASLKCPFDEEETLFLCQAESVLLKLLNIEPTEGVSESEVIDRILLYIETNLSRKITLEELSEQFSYSVPSISNQFRKNLHVSPLSYINTRKCIQASFLLRKGVSPKEAARQVGFGTYSTFYRAYLSNIGHSPAEDYSKPR